MATSIKEIKLMQGSSQVSPVVMADSVKNLDGTKYSAHTHAWSAITEKPSTFTPASHTHSEYVGKITKTSFSTGGNLPSMNVGQRIIYATPTNKVSYTPTSGTYFVVAQSTSNSNTSTQDVYLGANASIGSGNIYIERIS